MMTLCDFSVDEYAAECMLRYWMVNIVFEVGKYFELLASYGGVKIRGVEVKSLPTFVVSMG